MFRLEKLILNQKLVGLISRKREELKWQVFGSFCIIFILFPMAFE